MYKKASVMAKISKDLTSFMAVNGNSNPKRKQSIVSSHTESSNTSSINISPMMLEKNTSVSPFQAQIMGKGLMDEVQEEKSSSCTSSAKNKVEVSLPTF